MVRSAHLALPPKCFTVQFDFAVSVRYSYEKMHTASLGMLRRDPNDAVYVYSQVIVEIVLQTVAQH